MHSRRSKTRREEGIGKLRMLAPGGEPVPRRVGSMRETSKENQGLVFVYIILYGSIDPRRLRRFFDRNVRLG